MNLEKFLFKKIYVWVFLLFVILSFVFTIIFGSLVNYFSNGGHRFSYLKPLTYFLISIPKDIARIFEPNIHGLALDQSKFKNLSGLYLYEGNLEGYLLLAKVDENYTKPKVELIDINQKKIIHSWEFDLNKYKNYRNKKIKTFQMKHPFLFNNGDLLFKDQNGPLILINRCSEIKWAKIGSYHHSIEIDHNQHIWTGSAIDIDGFFHNSIIKISKEGVIKFEKAINEIFAENNLSHLIVTAKETGNPIHLNDIQPVLTDGSFWKKGDLFLSLRNLSMIMLYRPSTNKVLWYQQGPWIYQHDVDIMSENDISIFNNNLNLEKNEVKNNNETLIYNFLNNKTSNPYKKAYEINKIATPEAGLSVILKNGDIFVEETLNGRLLRMDKNGKIIWQYINRLKNNKLYILSWSRYLNNEVISKKLIGDLKKTCL